MQQFAVVQLDDRGIGRAGGTGVAALHKVLAQSAQRGQFDLELRQPVGHDGIVEGAGLDEPPKARVAQPLGQFQHRHPALGAQGGLRDLPAAVLGPHQVRPGDVYVVEEDLAEV